MTPEKVDIEEKKAEAVREKVDIEGEKVIIPPVLEYLGGIDTIGYSFQQIGGASTYSTVCNHIIENGYMQDYQPEENEEKYVPKFKENI